MLDICPLLDSLLAYVGAPHSAFVPPPAGFPTGGGIFGVSISGGTFYLIEVVLLLILECSPKLMSDFAARKICHSCSGLLFLTLDSRSAAGRGAMYLIGISSILMTWELTDLVGIKPFRFGSTRDVGITVYLVLVMLWFFAELPPAALAPMFFADPAGAVIGKCLTRNFPKYNKAWYEKKTIGGSAAVLIFTVLTLKLFYPPMPLPHMLMLSLAAPIAEAIGGAYDNLLLAAVVIGGYYLLEGTSNGSTISLDVNLALVSHDWRRSIASILSLIVGACGMCAAVLRRRMRSVAAMDEDATAVYSALLQ